MNTEDPEAPLCFHRAMKFPANHSKFEIKYDKQSERYYTLANPILDSKNTYSRNLLSLISSKNLYEWEVVLDIIDHRDKDAMLEGFQICRF